MRSRIGVWCDQVIEAGWLLAVIVAPLFFDVFSSRVFEPDKIGIVRIIATVMALAWIIRALEGLGRPAATDPDPTAGRPARWWARLRATPLALPTLALVAVYLLATACSITPVASVWGSYQRLQGLYSTLSYIVIFGLALTTLRRPDQLRRLLYAITLASLPIALYGLVQHYGLDPLPWGSDVTERVASNLGNPIFVAAYLIMVIPVTLAQAMQSARQAFAPLPAGRRLWPALLLAAIWLVQAATWALVGMGGGLLSSLAMVGIAAWVGLHLGHRLAPWVNLGVYGWVLTVQLLCVVFAQSRGPVLGLLAGLACLVWILLLARRRRHAARAIAIAAVAGLALLVVLKGAPPLERLRSLPYVSRLTDVLDVEAGTGKVRILIWEGAAQLIASDPVRAIVGYGPESMFVAYNRFYPPDLAHYEERSASPDRSHNETFDALISTGVLGLLAYLAVVATALRVALRALGLLPGPRDERRFWICLAVGLALGVAVPPLLDGGWRFLGLGVPAGILAGMLAYLAIGAFAKAKATATAAAQTSEAPAPDASTALSLPDTLLVVGLLGAVIAHYVEIHMGISIGATRLHFWLYLALLAQFARGALTVEERDAAAEPAIAALPARGSRTAGGRRAQRHVVRAAMGSSDAAPGPVAAAWSWAIIAGFVFATLAWDFVVNPQGSRALARILWLSLTSLAARTGTTAFSPGMLYMVGAVVAVGLLLAVVETDTRYWAAGRPVRWGPFVAAWAVAALALPAIYALIQASGLRPNADTTHLIYTYLGLLLAAGAGLAWALSRDKAAVPSAGPAWLAYPVLALAALWLVWPANVSMIRADVYYKNGMRAEGQVAWDQAIVAYQQALALQPEQDYYDLYLGRAQMERAKLLTDAAQREQGFDDAEATLQHAHELAPLNTDHVANLARLYRTRAAMESDETKRQADVQQSSAYYEQALTLSPHSAGLYNEWAAVYLDAGQYDRAQELLQVSLNIDSEYGQTYMVMGDISLVQGQYQAAIAQYQQAVQWDSSLTAAWGRLAYAQYQLGDLNAAIATNLELLKVAPGDYETLKNLAVIYRDAGQLENALDYARQALVVAPESAQASLQQFIDEIQAVEEGAAGS